MCPRSFNIITNDGLVAKDVPEDKVMILVSALLDKGESIVTIAEYFENPDNINSSMPKTKFIKFDCDSLYDNLDPIKDRIKAFSSVATIINQTTLKNGDVIVEYVPKENNQ